MLILFHWFSTSKRLTFSHSVAGRDEIATETFFIFSPKMVDGLNIFNFNHISKDLLE